VKISAQEYEHVSVMTLSGEFTHDDMEQFRRVLTDRREKGVRDVVLDCEHLDFVDSAGLEGWLRLQEDLGSQGGQLRVVHLDETVRTILSLTRLDLAFETHDTVEHAVRSLR
jgi:anti-sigma B factor antagonist